MRSRPIWIAITCCIRRARSCCVASDPSTTRRRATRARSRWSPTTPSGGFWSGGCARLEDDQADGAGEQRGHDDVEDPERAVSAEHSLRAGTEDQPHEAARQGGQEEERAERRRLDEGAAG